MNIDHLSDWQIEELLIAPLDAFNGIPGRRGIANETEHQARLHLENCRLCGSKKERLEETLLLYRQAALIKANEVAGSNRAMAVISGRAMNAHQPYAFFSDAFWRWPARAVAFLLLLAVLIPAFVSRERQRHHAQEFVKNRLLQEREQAQTKDDQLLQQVDQEITESVPEPMQPLTQPVLDNGSTGQ